MNVLVTGGAGYIGSHAIRRFRQAGHDVVALDNLDRGHREAVPADVPFEKLDLRETDALQNALRRHQIDTVCHCAALAYVGESVQYPLQYYDNNVGGSLSLLRAMLRAGVQRIVFSSTCATYGEPANMPLVEETPQTPLNPYGFSKLIVERMMDDLGATDKDFAFASLRYFNVAGCAEDGTLGEDHDPETHLIPILLRTALGQRDQAMIFGDDYPTPDGTCIRDYIHVEDLVDAHVLVASALHGGAQWHYNLGIGKGISVKEVVQATKRVSGVDIPVTIGPRRAGDASVLYADAAKIRCDLGWAAKITSIDEIIETTWRWFRNHPNGYRAP